MDVDFNFAVSCITCSTTEYTCELVHLLSGLPCICVISLVVKSKQHKSYKRSRLCLSFLLVSSTDSSTDSSSVVCADEEARAYAASWQEGERHLVGYW